MDIEALLHYMLMCWLCWGNVAKVLLQYWGVVGWTGAFIIVFGVGTFDSGEAFSSDALQLAKKRRQEAAVPVLNHWSWW